MATRCIKIRNLRCRACRWSTLSTFASLAGVSVPRDCTIQSRFVRSGTLSKSFATSRRFRDKDGLEHELSVSEMSSDDASLSREKEIPQDHDYNLKNPAITDSSSPNSRFDVPWYLRTQEVDGRSDQRYTQQQLPSIPSDCPQSLETITEHLFSDIGLDDLRILDLRTMDPPPALGANLLMILGTARSERHLHVSADRFCRWLRSTYRLRPFADGLVGRNEMKLRLKRKAKRAKLLGSKPAPEGDIDDGLRTGWICVNVGAIASESASQHAIEEAGIVGFRDSENGVHLVVQMMTEARREELDLEKLWLGALARQDRRQDTAIDEEPLSHSGGAGEVGAGYGSRTANADNALRSQRQTKPRNKISWSRQLHTERTKIRDDSTVATNVLLLSVKGKHQYSSIAPSASADWCLLEESGMRERLSRFQKLPLPLLEPEHHQIIRGLISVDPAVAICRLGNETASMETISSLLASSGKGVSLERQKAWHSRLWGALYGMLIGHAECTPENVMTLFAAFEQDMPQPCSQIYRFAVEAFMPGPTRLPTLLANFPRLTNQTNAFISHCLYQIQSSPKTQDTYLLVERSLLAYFRSLTGSNNRVTQSLHTLKPIFDVRRAVIASGPQYLSEDLHLEILSHLAVLSPDLKHFLDYWARIPIMSGSRSADLYVSFYTHLAVSGSQKLLVRALDEWVDVMDHEVPPVACVDAVARSLMRCISIIEPEVEQLVKEEKELSHHAQIWRRCQAVSGISF